MIRRKIKYLRHNKEYELRAFGNWIDLAASKEYNLQPNEFKIIDLGLSMQLPKYYEANIVPRSSTFKNFGILQTNSFGIVDTEYCGPNDRWGFPALAGKNHAYVGKNDRICQFRVNLTMDAPWWAKLANIFVKFEFEEVHVLHGKNRNGFGSSGIK